jgi:hypothetical protein
MKGMPLQQKNQGTDRTKTLEIFVLNLVDDMQVAPRNTKA